jgi:hypothetical protein
MISPLTYAGMYLSIILILLLPESTSEIESYPCFVVLPSIYGYLEHNMII